MKLHWLFSPYMRPAEGEGSPGGGAVDRGDDFTATDEDEDEKKVLDAPGDDEADAKKLAEEAEAAAAKAKETEGEKKEEGDDKDKAKKKDDRIPAARHKEILEKERAQRESVERELAKYKQGEQIAVTNDEIAKDELKLAELEAAYTKQITDGQPDKAAQTMKEIRTLERSVSNKTTEIRIAAAEGRAIEQARYETTLDRIEEAYPALQEGHADYDKDKVKEVLELKRGFQLQGYTPSQAVQKAVKYVMPKAETKAQKTATEVEARVGKDEVEAARKKAAAAAAADANKKTPASSSKVGLDSDKAGGDMSAKNVMKMKQEDFAKLDEETLSRMRGDTLAA